MIEIEMESLMFLSELPLVEQFLDESDDSRHPGNPFSWFTIKAAVKRGYQGRPLSWLTIEVVVWRKPSLKAFGCWLARR